MAIFFYRLHCRHCGHTEILSRHEAERRLQAHKKLRAGVQTDEALLDELVPNLLPQTPCRQCGTMPLQVTVQHDVGDWSEQKRCIACGGVIPAARLAVFPEAEMCTKCQSAVDRGETPGPPVFCRRCGSPMRIGTRQIGGRTRYVWICTNETGCSYWCESIR
ncbi:MAG: TraR/DksA C4-type zinc finger protein [Thermogutta sp.]|uniref:TraR/DksA C4-type zinc finger protein n=1 Tax=Thermogutta terrifontis TaxID=1331910 RepID=UPI000BA8B735|nr:TraR/DksA C4-type zinc finger protein [Thermogutta terrifontis]